MRLISGAIRLAECVVCINHDVGDEIVVRIGEACPICGREPRALISGWLDGKIRSLLESPVYR